MRNPLVSQYAWTSTKSLTPLNVLRQAVELPAEQAGAAWRARTQSISLLPGAFAQLGQPGKIAKVIGLEIGLEIGGINNEDRTER